MSLPRLTSAIATSFITLRSGTDPLCSCSVTPMAKLKAPRFGLVGVHLCLCAVWASDDWQHKPTCAGFGELAVATSCSPSAVPVPVGADPARSQHAHPVLCALQYTVCLRVKPGFLLLKWLLYSQTVYWDQEVFSLVSFAVHTIWLLDCFIFNIFKDLASSAKWKNGSVEKGLHFS